MFKRKKKFYHYLVAFTFKGGIGTITLELKRKIKTVDDIKEIQDYIMKTNEGITNVGITNYQLIGRY